MNQEKTGKFIATCRKEKSLTQSQLAEKLNITDRAVSKWERGKGMPDSSIMLPLCEELGISVDELLCGEKIEVEKHTKKQDELILNMAKEVQQKDKIIITCMWIIMAISIIGMTAGIFLAEAFIPVGIWQVLCILGICILFLIPCFYALKLEVSVGCYKCKKCGHEIVPTYTEALMAMHRGTTRHLKCPNCNKRTWCKKYYKKDNEI